MTSAQFFIILGTIYLVPDMEPESRKFIGLVLFVLAVITGFLE
jgi:uncharacterized membrane protein